MTMPFIVTLFAFVGAMFGLATHAHRHLFSEGHTKRQASDEADPMQGRVAWTLLCSVLWPLMALTGMYSWWAVRSR